MFKKIDPKLNLPEKEKIILDFWRENKVFEKSLKKEAQKDKFVFYEGPPTANGRPGIHHVEARSFKDLFCRYKTMQGYYVKRKAGWDTHGLPVELQVEKELGISGKPEIENIIAGDKKASIEKFNQLCRESVWKYKKDWEEMTERMAYWVEMTDPYITYESKYIESVWSIIAEIDKAGLLYKGHKVVPFCPRCGTALSSHEVALGYKKIEEESIYFKVKSKKESTFFLVWTTTPWTLAGNSALAFGPKLTYVTIQSKDEKLIIAKDRAKAVFGDNPKIIDEFSGKELIDKYTGNGADYEPLYPDGEKYHEAGELSYKIILADFVTANDGTGVVHIAPAFGEDDYIWGYQKNRIKVLKTVDEKGTELAGAGAGKFVKNADSDIKEDLSSRDILFKKENHAHDYPFCWRCETPLLYMAKDSWYIAMSKLKSKLIKNNEKINWNPSYLKAGRFGNWLENINDWAISRDRYWGTPLPIWECQKCGKYRVVSSLLEIGNIDPHKPQIDEVTFNCQCGQKMKRTSEVMDVWLDSGAMPFAQYGWPNGDVKIFEEQFPADFICEAVDQTRGWFYTLLALSTIIKDAPAYKNVISVGLVMDEKGKKMSKSLGNIVMPKEAFDKFGADVVRYYFYSVNQPGETKLFSEKEIVSISRNLFLTLWNVYSFFATYAVVDKFTPAGKLTSENILDKWILSKLAETIRTVEESLDKYDPYNASNTIIDYITELSTWYIRRSRRRFWKSENDQDKNNAYETLYFVLIETTKLLAPFTPMFAEAIYQGLKNENDPESVHLAEFAMKIECDHRVLEEMAAVKEIVSLGLSQRAEAGIKVRQPLQTLSYKGKKIDQELEEIVKDEINVKEIKFVEKLKEQVQIDTIITEELKTEGIARELIRRIQSLRKKSQLNVEDRINLCFQTKSKNILHAFEKFEELISREVLAEGVKNNVSDLKHSEEIKIDLELATIAIERLNKK